MPGFSLKPDMEFLFRQMPFVIRVSVRYDYFHTDTHEEMADLCHYWLNVSETCTNKNYQFWFQKAAEYLYSALTNRHYETRQFQTF